MTDLAVDPVYEIGYDGELGFVIAYHLAGHIDLARTDEIMEAVQAEGYGLAFDGPERGWDVTWEWVREVPARDDEGQLVEGTWTYAYSDHEVPGSRPITRVQEDSTWRYRCVNHPEEVATTGRPRRQFLDADDIVVTDPDVWEQVCNDEHVFMCRPCGRDLDVRLRAARFYAVQKEPA